MKSPTDNKSTIAAGEADSVEWPVSRRSPTLWPSGVRGGATIDHGRTQAMTYRTVFNCGLVAYVVVPTVRSACIL